MSGFKVGGGKLDSRESWGRRSRCFPTFYNMKPYFCPLAYRVAA